MQLCVFKQNYQEWSEWSENEAPIKANNIKYYVTLSVDPIGIKVLRLSLSLYPLSIKR